MLEYADMKLSVIIPAFNNIDMVLLCLYSLRAHANTQTEIEYLVQDDASPEYDGRRVISSDLALVERNNRNLGFPGNANRGAERAQGDALFFVNQDVYALWRWSENWDIALLKALTGPSVGVVGARLLSPSGAIQSAGGEFDVKGQPYHRFLGNDEPCDCHTGLAREVSWTTGAAFATPASLWRDIGGFDEAYGRGYFEDADYCLKARERGCRIWYEPQCTFVHRVGSTGGSPTFTKSALLFRKRWANKVKPDTNEIRTWYW